MAEIHLDGLIFTKSPYEHCLVNFEVVELVQGPKFLGCTSAWAVTMIYILEIRFLQRIKKKS